METKFKQPVSMQVTKEQYERDLREPLLMLGYEEVCFTDLDKHNILITSENGLVSNSNEKSCFICGRYFIDHYNPKLFLAIAAMTDSVSPIVREWFVYTDYVVERAGYKVGVLYKNENPLTNARWKRKATLQELIDKFKKQEENMETKELIENLKPLIAPENMEKFNKLMGIEKPLFKKEDFITGDKVVLRSGNTYLVIRDCNGGKYGAQVFVLLQCAKSEGFVNSDEYDDKLNDKDRETEYDIMKIYRYREGGICSTSISNNLIGYSLIWSRE